MSDIKLIHGDMLIEHERIEDGTVDLILTDLPYGNMKNAPSTWDKEKTKWDTIIPVGEVFKKANRILRQNGRLILFSQEPYSTQLIYNSISNVPFNYRAIWYKDNFANALGVNKNMVSMHEDVLIFSKKHDVEAAHPLRGYAHKVRQYISYSRRKLYKTLGHGGAQHFLESNKESSQFNLCTQSTYSQLINIYDIDGMEGFKTYQELRIIDRKYDSTFNLWEGNKFKSNILEYKKDYNGYHPTQKPILLLEDLIKTFSNENDLVVDLTMGSGSTGVAAKNTNRKFIGIELDKGYFEIANERIDNLQTKLL